MFCFQNQKAHFLLVLLKKKKNPKRSSILHRSTKPSYDSERPPAKLKWLSLQPHEEIKKKGGGESIQYLRQYLAKVTELFIFFQISSLQSLSVALWQHFGKTASTGEVTEQLRKFLCCLCAHSRQA